MFPATHALIEDQREGALMTTLDAAPKKKPEPSTEEMAAKRVKQITTECSLQRDTDGWPPKTISQQPQP